MTTLPRGRGRRQAAEEPSDSSVSPAAVPRRLASARRRVVLLRAATWTALAAGPVALLLSLGAPSAPATVAVPQRAAPTARPVDPAGYAEMFVALWLRSGEEGATAQAEAVAAMAPDVQLPAVTVAQPEIERVAAVRSVPLRSGWWSVIVAVQTGGAELRYFQVPLVAGGQAGAAGSGAVSVAAAPAEVAGPGEVEVPEGPYEEAVPSSAPAAVSVEEFLGAYLTGLGEVERYLAPGTRLAAVGARPYQEVTVESIAADGDAAAAEEVPADGTRTRVAVQVLAVDEGGQWPLTYHLALSARGGRWEIAALEAGPETGAAGAGAAGTAVLPGGAR